MKRLCLLIIFAGGASMAAAQELEVVTVEPWAVKPQIFVEGAILGDGVVEKEYELPLKETTNKQAKSKFQSSHKANHKDRAIASVDAGATTGSPRSIASFSEDRKFSNEVIAQVRSKDAADREATREIVRAAIERGDFGSAAKARLSREPAGADSPK